MKSTVSRKMSKINHHHSITTASKADVLSVKFRRPFKQLISKKNAAISDISSIAKQLKERLSRAAKSITITDISAMDTISSTNAQATVDQCPSLVASSPSTDSDADGDVTMETVSFEPASPTDAVIAVSAAKSPVYSTLDYENENNKNNRKTTTITLSNLELLKRYLLFISQETTEIQLDSLNSQLTFHCPQQEEVVLNHSARLGATLIESFVHESPVMMEKRLKHLQVGSKSVLQRNRRGPGRPPKTPVNNDDATIQKRRKSSILQQQRQLEKQKLKKENCNTIHCICDTPHEEFGSMVQCDDCYQWLHVECLELDDEALGEEEPFRCPLCFLSMGNIYEDSGKNAKSAKMISSITWRYAAQWKSRRLADSARYEKHNTDDEDDDDDDDDIMMNDLCMDTSAHPLEVDEAFSDSHYPNLDPINTNVQESFPVTLSPSPLTPVNYISTQHSKSEEDDGYSTTEDVSSGPVTPTSTDWPDISSESRYSISSQDSLSTISSVCTSEVTTPTVEFPSASSTSIVAAAALAAAAAAASTTGAGVYASDPFDLKEMNQLLFNQTVESLEILHQLVYLESSVLQNRTPKLFSPNASDVFLCGDALAKHGSNCSISSSLTPVPVLSAQTSYFVSASEADEATSINNSTTYSSTLSTATNKAPASSRPLAAPPSDVCSQDLTEYSFDSGPFWNPLY